MKYDLTGKRFGKLTVIGVEKSGEHKYWKCVCDCGEIKIASTSYLLNGTTKSCGHERRNPNRIDTPCNGNPITRGGKRKLCYLPHQRILRIRRGMIERCENKNRGNYKYYGGKGISVCEEWRRNPLSFYDWAIKNGYNDNLTIDRINADGNYEPSNCRWVDMKTQNRNKDNNVSVIYKGEEKPLCEWCELLGIPYETIRYRIFKLNMDIEEAFTVPINGIK